MLNSYIRIANFLNIGIKPFSQTFRKRTQDMTICCWKFLKSVKPPACIRNFSRPTSYCPLTHYPWLLGQTNWATFNPFNEGDFFFGLQIRDWLFCMH